MPDEDKKGYTYCVAIGSLIIGICFLFNLFGSSGKDRAELQANTDRTMGEISVQHQLVRSKLDSGTGEIDRAGDAIQRAHELVNQCQRGIGRSQKGNAECQKLIAECRASLDEVKRIIFAIENSDGS